MWWLTTVRQRSGQSTVDFDKMPLHDFQRLVPDQLDNAAFLGAFGIETAGALARTIRAPPLLSTCTLCLLGPLIKHGNAGVLQDVQNFPRLVAVAKEHQEKYGIPPTPDWMVKALISHTSKRASQTGLAAPEKCKTKPPDAIPQDASSSTGLGVAASKKQAVAKPGDASPQGASASTGLGVAASKRQAVAKPGDASPQGASASTDHRAAESKKQAEDVGSTTVMWYPTKPARHNSCANHKCSCKGNCHGNCPARKPKGVCPNSVVTGAFCVACRCRHPGCDKNARRPFGHYCFVENRGYCQGHYPKRD